MDYDDFDLGNWDDPDFADANSPYFFLNESIDESEKKRRSEYYAV